MKKYLSLLAITSFMFVAAVVLAEETNTSTTSQPKPYYKEPYAKEQRPLLDAKMKARVEVNSKDTLKPPFNAEFKAGAKADRLEYKNEIKAEKGEFKAGIQAERKEFHESLTKQREALKAGEITKEEFQAKAKAAHEALKVELKAKRESFKEEIKAKKEEFKNKAPELKEKFREGVKNMLGQRFESAVTNLERMQARVGALIDKMEDAGKDTGEAEEYLNDSKEKLADAKTKLAEVKKLLPAEGTEVSAETFEKIKVGAREAKDLLKEAHSLTVEAIKELKGLSEGKEEESEE